MPIPRTVGRASIEAWFLGRLAEIRKQSTISPPQSREVPRSNHEALKEIGLAHLAAGHDKAARIAFDRSLEASPNCSHCWIALARTYRRIDPQGDFAALLRQHNYPYEPREALLIRRAEALRFVGRFDDALDELDAAARTAPDLLKTTFFLNERGLVLSNGQRFEEALRTMDAALEINPESLTALYNAAVAAARLGSPDVQSRVTAAEAACSTAAGLPSARTRAGTAWQA